MKRSMKKPMNRPMKKGNHKPNNPIKDKQRKFLKQLNNSQYRKENIRWDRLRKRFLPHN